MLLARDVKFKERLGVGKERKQQGKVFIPTNADIVCAVLGVSQTRPVTFMDELRVSHSVGCLQAGQAVRRRRVAVC